MAHDNSHLYNIKINNNNIKTCKFIAETHAIKFKILSTDTLALTS